MVGVIRIEVLPGRNDEERERMCEDINESFSRWTRNSRLEKGGSEARKGLMNCDKMMGQWTKDTEFCELGLLLQMKWWDRRNWSWDNFEVSEMEVRFRRRRMSVGNMMSSVLERLCLRNPWGV